MKMMMNKIELVEVCCAKVHLPCTKLYIDQEWTVDCGQR